MKNHYPTLTIVVLAFILLNSCSNDNNDPTPEEQVEVPALSNEKQILSFQLGLTTDLCSGEISNTINETEKTITITVTANTPITSVIPDMELSAGAFVSPNSAQDFNQPVSYLVTAEDNTTAEYTVNVVPALSDHSILMKLLEANPDNRTNWDPDNPDLNTWNGVVADEQGRVLELNLTQADISVLPPEIGTLCALEQLNLTNNPLQGIPNEIGQLKNLKVLNLNNTGIHSLPADIGGLSLLARFTASGNDIDAIPNEIGQLANLESLDLSANSLVLLPDGIGQLASLIRLDLEGNDTRHRLPRPTGRRRTADRRPHRDRPHRAPPVPRRAAAGSREGALALLPLSPRSP
jgi:Leucine-rich repeat (LRR) protein